MKVFSSLSIRSQILILVMVLVVISLVSLAALTIVQLRNHLTQSLEEEAIILCTLMGDGVAPGMEFQDSLFIADIVQRATSSGKIVEICICDSDDNIVLRELHKDIPSSLVELCSSADTLTITHLDGYCVVTKAIHFRGKMVGDLRLALSEKPVADRIASSIKLVVGFSVLVLLLAVSVGLAISHRIVRPIKIFEQASNRISAGDMVSSIGTTVFHKDFATLGKAFNRMQERLKEAFAELEGSRDNLEDQVQQRTLELEKELGDKNQAELAQRESAERLRATLESTADGILVVNDEGEATHANARFAELWHIPKELLDTHDDSKLIAHVLDQLTDPVAFLDKVNALYHSTDESFDVLNFKDGRVFERFSCPLIREGGAAGRVWSFRDITDRVNNEQKRLDLQSKLERAQRMESLGILAGGVAHDLNNMLGPLVGYPELILSKLPDDSPVRTQLLRVAGAAHSAAEVVQDLLTLARRGRYEMEPIYLNEVIEGYLDSPSLIRLRHLHPNVQLSISLESDAQMILGSMAHLGKVVMNLIVNAFDAMPDGGELTVQTTQRHLNALLGGYEKVKEGDYVLLSVRDTGTGIAAEDIDKIFEPYYSKKKIGSSGSGLGLSVVYGIVKDHKGFYDIKSTIGEGTEFILYFPITSEQAREKDLKVEQVGGSETLLVVDDNPDQRQMACDLLESLGYEVEIAIHGHDAIEFLKDRTVDLVLLDMIMEKNFDGLDTYREIIKTHPGQQALIVSGFSATERVAEMQKLGAGQYIRKPYTRDTIARAIREELDKTVDFRRPPVHQV